MITSDSLVLTLDWIPDVSFLISIGQPHVHRGKIQINTYKFMQLPLNHSNINIILDKKNGKKDSF